MLSTCRMLNIAGRRSQAWHLGSGPQLCYCSCMLLHVSSAVTAAPTGLLTTRRQMDFEVQDHVQLGTALGLIDFEAGAAVSGTKFVYLRGAGALLEVGMPQYSSPEQSHYTVVQRKPAVQQPSFGCEAPGLHPKHHPQSDGVALDVRLVVGHTHG